MANKTFSANLAWLCDALDDAASCANAMRTQADSDESIVELRGAVDALLSSLINAGAQAWQINNDYLTIEIEREAI